MIDSFLIEYATVGHNNESGVNAEEVRCVNHNRLFKSYRNRIAGSFVSRQPPFSDTTFDVSPVMTAFALRSDTKSLVAVLVESSTVLKLNRVDSSTVLKFNR